MYQRSSQQETEMTSSKRALNSSGPSKLQDLIERPERQTLGPATVLRGPYLYFCQKLTQSNRIGSSHFHIGSPKFRFHKPKVISTGYWSIVS